MYIFMSRCFTKRLQSRPLNWHIRKILRKTWSRCELSFKRTALGRWCYQFLHRQLSSLEFLVEDVVWFAEVSFLNRSPYGKNDVDTFFSSNVSYLNQNYTQDDLNSCSAFEVWITSTSEQKFCRSSAFAIYTNISNSLKSLIKTTGGSLRSFAPSVVDLVRIVMSIRWWVFYYASLLLLTSPQENIL